MTEGLFQTQSLRKEYFEVVAVDDVDFSVPAGEIFGLIGPNGAGKTTLLRMLATSLEPTSGRVFFDGTDVWKNPVKLRSAIGFVPDFFLMYDKLTVRELLKYFAIAHDMPRARIGPRVEEVLGLIDLRDKADTLVKGLSRGMMQRLGAGRAILHEPRALLLDEPASGLDPLARMALFELLKRIHANGTTILISSHILGELTDVCTSVGIMHDGRFLETGPVDEIIKKVMPHRTITLRIVAGLEAARKVVSGEANVAAVEDCEQGLRITFTGTDQQLAEMNARLVGANVALALAEEARTSLNELYFAIAQGNENAAAE